MNETTKGQTTQKSAEGAFLTIVYNGEKVTLTAEQATTLAQKGMNYDRVVRQRDELLSKPQSISKEAIEQQRLEEDWARFIKKYPDVRPDETLPKDVWALLEEGLLPCEAYAEFLLKKQAKQLSHLARLLEQERKNAAARQKSPGSSATASGFVGDSDSFLEGLMMGY